MIYAALKHDPSGSTLVNKRYDQVLNLLARDNPRAARGVAQEVLELAPDWPPGLMVLGQTLYALKDFESAAKTFRTLLDLDPRDPHGAGVYLAMMRRLKPDEAIQPTYVRALFDAYAPNFERHLVKRLKYKGPQLIKTALEQVKTPAHRFERTLDLGCGTGLMGEAIRTSTRALLGCDLSPLMVEKARAKPVYDDLQVCECAEFLENQSEEVDLILAADVMIYLPNLLPTFRAASRVLKPEGLFAFTIQTWLGEGDCHLGQDGRMAHAELYVMRTARQSGLGLSCVESAILRYEAGQAVPALIFVLQKP